MEGTKHGSGKVPMLRTGIAWPSDKSIKFRNPEGDLEQALKGFAKPRDWEKPLWQLDTENPDNNGFQNEDLIVWMRTAALPSFRKLYRHVDTSVATYENGLTAGKYRLQVQYRKNSDFLPVYLFSFISHGFYPLQATPSRTLRAPNR